MARLGSDGGDEAMFAACAAMHPTQRRKADTPGARLRLTAMSESVMPSDADQRPGLFDRMASAVSRVTARAWFFAACLALVVIWLPSYFLVGSVDTWQLLINTATTIVTFLMVALLQNTDARADQAVQHKLNATAKAQLLVLTTLGHGDTDEAGELRAAVGIERNESAG